MVCVFVGYFFGHQKRLPNNKSKWLLFPNFFFIVLSLIETLKFKGFDLFVLIDLMGNLTIIKCHFPNSDGIRICGSHLDMIYQRMGQASDRKVVQHLTYSHTQSSESPKKKTWIIGCLYCIIREHLKVIINMRTSIHFSSREVAYLDLSWASRRRCLS